ncbi:NACHT domain-containing protein [Planomonospora algeriensis]
MSRDRRSGRMYGVISAAAFLTALAAAAAGAWLLPEAQGVGDVDPLSAVIALLALAVSLWTLHLSQRQPLTWAEALEKLATDVLTTEQEARHRLLGGGLAPINVTFALRRAPTRQVMAFPSGGTLREIVAYYRPPRSRSPHRLVITGAPGGGKTVLAVELMLGLFAGRRAGDPVPVRISAASWDTRRSVEELLQGWMVDVFRLPAAVAGRLVAARLVLPVLDGLDEMDADPAPGGASRAGRALAQVDAYLHGSDRADVVLTCRTAQYQALRAARSGGADITWVEILPVRPVTAAGFLRDRIQDSPRWRRWDQVLETMRADPDGPLAKGLSTPWRLTLAVTVYERPALGDDSGEPHRAVACDPAELIALGSAEAIADHLLARLIGAVTPADAPYTPRQVRSWLAVLARYLDRNASGPPPVPDGRSLSGTDLVLYELWPLAGFRLPRILHALPVALPWVLAGVTGVLAWGFDLAVGIAILAGLIVTAGAWSAWPEPRHLRVPVLTARADWRRIVSGTVVGLAAGLAGNLVVGVLAGLVIGLVETSTGFGTATARTPRTVVRSDAANGLVVGSGIGLAAGLGIAFTAGPVPGLVAGVAAGLAFGLPTATVTVRYLAFLLCTRRWSRRPLPWRLGRFLHWCTQVGLIRVAGIAYQFRHRELQDHLARHPAPGPVNRREAPAGA